MWFGRRRVVREIVAQFEAEESQLDGIRRFVIESCRGSDLTSKDVNGVLLAIEEACTNVIRHAYLYAKGTIRIHIALAGDQVTFSIYDRGRSFDFDRAGVPDLGRYVETGRKGGLGIYLIRKIMDEVDYRTIGDENRLRMVKFFPRVKRVKGGSPGTSIRVKFSFYASLVVFVIVSVIYVYFDSRLTTGTEIRVAEEVKRLGHTVAATAGNYIRNQRSDAEFDELVHQSGRDVPGLKELVIVNPKNMVLASAESPSLMHAPYNVPIGDPWSRDAEVTRVEVDGEWVLYFAARIEGGGRVYVGIAEKVIATAVAKGRRGAQIISAVGLVVGILAVYFLSIYFVKPIQRITEGVRRIGSGDLDTHLTVEGDDEFAQIASAFNEMTVKFKKSQDSRVEQERLQKEMQVAQEIQHALLPTTFPEIEGYDLATIYQAAKDVGGDYFDFVWIDEKTLGIVVADVSGKGVPGSLVMTMIRTAIRLESRGNSNAVDILKRVNDFVSEDVKRGMFITIFMVVLDAEKRKISFASAGHNPLILYRAREEKTYFLNPKGIPMGMQLPEGVDFGGRLEADTVRLQKDDLLVIYTDGVTEAMNPKREQYGIDRFLEFIKKNAALSADDFVAELQKDLGSFTGNAPQNDDITLVAIKEEVELDQVIYQKRRQLIDLVELQGLSVKDACERMGVSTSTFYKYRRRFEKEGAAGLFDRKSRAKQGARQLSVDERELLLRLVVLEPDWGATRLKRKLALPEHGALDIDERSVYDELVRVNLNTRERRIAYALRQGHANPDELQARLVGLKRTNRNVETDSDRADRMEAEYSALARDRVQSVLDRMDDEARKSGLGEVDRQLLKEVIDELAPVADGGVLADFVTSMVAKLAGTRRASHPADTGPRVLDSDQWTDESREGFEKLKSKGLDVPSDDDAADSAGMPSLDDIVSRRSRKDRSK